MKTVAIIPARYGSTRFPGKPLAIIGNKPMIQWVYEQTAKAKSIDEVWVATDDERIADAVAAFGGQAAMTSKEHTCGTNRCAELAREIHLHSTDIIINVQGDEPMIVPEQIDFLVQVTKAEDLSTLICESTVADRKNRNCVKVITTIDDLAARFSRKHMYGYTNYRHIGVYGYSMLILHWLTQIPETKNKDNLEQVKWLEAGYPITCVQVDYHGVSVDTPDDLIKVQKLIGNG